MLPPTAVHLAHPTGSPAALRIELLAPNRPPTAVFFLMAGQSQTFTIHDGTYLRISTISPDYVPAAASHPPHYV